MHASYAEKGLRIMGFPCNQFGGQVTFDLTYFVLYHKNILRVANKITQWLIMLHLPSVRLSLLEYSCPARWWSFKK